MNLEQKRYLEQALQLKITQNANNPPQQHAFRELLEEVQQAERHTKVRPGAVVSVIFGLSENKQYLVTGQTPPVSRLNGFHLIGVASSLGSVLQKKEAKDTFTIHEDHPTGRIAITGTVVAVT